MFSFLTFSSSKSVGDDIPHCDLNYTESTEKLSECATSSLTD